MGGQKYEPNQTKVNQSEPNQSKPTSDKLQTTQTNRQIGWIFPFLLHISISPYLPIFMPIFVPISVPILRAYASV